MVVWCVFCVIKLRDIAYVPCLLTSSYHSFTYIVYNAQSLFRLSRLPCMPCVCLNGVLEPKINFSSSLSLRCINSSSLLLHFSCVLFASGKLSSAWHRTHRQRNDIGGKFELWKKQTRSRKAKSSAHNPKNRLVERVSLALCFRSLFFSRCSIKTHPF